MHFAPFLGTPRLKLLCYFPVIMTGTALLVGLNGVVTGGNHQSVHITVTPACFVSNLTSLPLQLKLHGTLTGPSTLPCAAGATLALLQTWAADPAATLPTADSPPSPSAVAAKSFSASDSSSPGISPAADAACRVSITVAEGECGTANGDGVLPPNIIPLSRATARERMELTQVGNGDSILLTYRVLRAHGYQHLVVFEVRDCSVAS